MALTTVAERFLAVWIQWKQAIPESLHNEDPVMLCKLLRLADVDEGITQKSLGLGADVIQSKTSKVMKILREEQWLETVARSGADGRNTFVRLTSDARDSLAKAEKTLTTTLRQAKARRRRRLRPPPSNMRIPSTFQ